MKLRPQALSDPHPRRPGASGFLPLAGRADIAPPVGATCENIAAVIIEMRAGWKIGTATVARDRKFDGSPHCGRPTEGRDAVARPGERFLGGDVAASGSLRIVGRTMRTGFAPNGAHPRSVDPARHREPSAAA